LIPDDFWFSNGNLQRFFYFNVPDCTNIAKQGKTFEYNVLNDIVFLKMEKTVVSI